MHAVAVKRGIEHEAMKVERTALTLFSRSWTDVDGVYIDYSGTSLCSTQCGPSTRGGV